MHEHGANLECRRLNGQTPAHGAAILGQLDILKRLHELGADVVHAYDDQGKSPLDYASYFCHKDAAEYLRTLHTEEGGLTRYERRKLERAAIMIQAMAKGQAARRTAHTLRALRTPAKKDKVEGGFDLMTAAVAEGA